MTNTSELDQRYNAVRRSLNLAYNGTSKGLDDIAGLDGFVKGLLDLKDAEIVALQTRLDAANEYLNRCLECGKPLGFNGYCPPCNAWNVGRKQF